MLGRKKPGSGVAGGTTLISHDTTVVGELRFAGNLDVEGLVKGNIIAESGAQALVRVVGKGRVEGEIRAPYVVINGIVQGDVHASRQLELAPKGQVNGNVYYSTVEMAAGAEVNGSLTHVGSVEDLQEKPVDGAENPSESAD
ncbi:MAG: cytoskeletal protein CcmA (bactofilin family) [Bacteroidia bacterium]|jgi:cytoskeletal protein CcmA (bactofilin family)